MAERTDWCSVTVMAPAEEYDASGGPVMAGWAMVHVAGLGKETLPASRDHLAEDAVQELERG